jgi:hypothetical protein
MPATPNPIMNTSNDLLYGLHQSRLDRNYSSNNNNNNNNTSEQDKLLNTSPLRTDLKLSVNIFLNEILSYLFFFLKNEQITFARDLFRSSTCLTRADKSRILAFIAGVRGNVK